MPFEGLILLTTLIVTLSIFALIWAVHIPKKDAGIIDLYWGPGFAVIALITFKSGGHHTPLHIIFLTATIV